MIRAESTSIFKVRDPDALQGSQGCKHFGLDQYVYYGTPFVQKVLDVYLVLLTQLCSFTMPSSQGVMYIRTSEAAIVTIAT